MLQGEFSLSLKGIPRMPDAGVLLNTDLENEKFLKTSAIWHDPVESDELDAIGLELRRQDLKISLLLEMVSELLIRQSQLPPLVALQMTAESLQCIYSGQPLAPGSAVEVTLYIMPAFPKALKLYGEVVPSPEAGKLTLQFIGMSPAVQDRIEKLIFTQHRRSIAHGLGV